MKYFRLTFEYIQLILNNNNNIFQLHNVFLNKSN